MLQELQSMVRSRVRDRSYKSAPCSIEAPNLAKSSRLLHSLKYQTLLATLGKESKDQASLKVSSSRSDDALSLKVAPRASDSRSLRS